MTEEEDDAMREFLLTKPEITYGDLAMTAVVIILYWQLLSASLLIATVTVLGGFGLAYLAMRAISLAALWYWYR